jgi:5'-nucleotidase
VEKLGEKRLIIMVTNDDGINSQGLSTLADALTSIAEVWVVAPDREMSAVSHSLTLHKPIRVKEIASKYYSVNGTPTDCVNLSVNSILKTKPDLIVSGINKGGNLGDDISTLVLSLLPEKELCSTYHLLQSP